MLFFIPIVTSIVIMGFFYSSLKIADLIRPNLRPKISGSENAKGFKKIFLNKYPAKFMALRRSLYIALFLLSIFCSYLVFKNLWLSLLITISLLVVSADLLKGFRSRERSVLSNQLLKFLNDISIMLSSGKTLRQVFVEAPSFSEEPLKRYLTDVSIRLDSGSSLENALDAFSRQAKNKDINLLVDALKINIRLGGRLSYILQNIGSSVRQEIRRRDNSNILTLQSRYSGNLIALFPVFILMVLSVFLKDTVEPFLDSNIGNVCIIAGGIFEFLGIFTIKKILRQSNP